jgi:hypothetical protein
MHPAGVRMDSDGKANGLAHGSNCLRRPAWSGHRCAEPRTLRPALRATRPCTRPRLPSTCVQGSRRVGAAVAGSARCAWPLPPWLRGKLSSSFINGDGRRGLSVFGAGCLRRRGAMRTTAATVGMAWHRGRRLAAGMASRPQRAGQRAWP